jgi:hypothetical protein
MGVDGLRAMVAGVLSGAPSPPQAAMRARIGIVRRRETGIAANVVSGGEADKSGRRGFRLGSVRLDWLGLRRSHQTSDGKWGQTRISKKFESDPILSNDNYFSGRYVIFQIRPPLSSLT